MSFCLLFSSSFEIVYFVTSWNSSFLWLCFHFWYASKCINVLEKSWICVFYFIFIYFQFSKEKMAHFGFETSEGVSIVFFSMKNWLSGWYQSCPNLQHCHWANKLQDDFILWRFRKSNGCLQFPKHLVTFSCWRLGRGKGFFLNFLWKPTQISGRSRWDHQSSGIGQWTSFNQQNPVLRVRFVKKANFAVTFCSFGWWTALNCCFKQW